MHNLIATELKYICLRWGRRLDREQRSHMYQELLLPAGIRSGGYFMKVFCIFQIFHRVYLYYFLIGIDKWIMDGRIHTERKTERQTDRRQEGREGMREGKEGRKREESKFSN